MADLKPCPFCGGDAVLWRVGSGRAAWIACMGECSVLVSREFENDAAAIAAWNRRAPAPRDEVIRQLVEAAEDAHYDLCQWLECEKSLVAAGFNMDGTADVIAKLDTALAATRKLGVG